MIAYMIDQSHNLKPKIEEMIQTAMNAQELYAKAAIVDYENLARFQQTCALVDAERCLRDAFSEDVRPAIRAWRRSRGLAEDPLLEFRAGGYLERITAEREERNRQTLSSYA
jgi:L-rhamnose isomerase/sugar isomerase